jgi:fucose permease
VPPETAAVAAPDHAALPAPPVLPAPPSPPNPSFDAVSRATILTGFAAFLLLGWTALLVPSLVRQVEAEFGQSDSGIGLLYLLNAVLWVTGTFGGGVLTERIGRRAVLPTGAFLMALGLVGLVAAPSWGLFLLADVIMGLGGGIIDAGANALFMDLFSARRSGALNRLHLFFSIGALSAPLVIGQLVGAGVAWRLVVGLSAAAATFVGLALFSCDLPSGRHRRQPPEPTPAGSAAATAPPSLLRRLPLPLLALAVAIGCYVPSEMGVSNWLVRYLDQAPVEIATLGLSLFWAGLALGRFVSSFIADRMGSVRFATTAALLAGVCIVGAVLAPWLPVSIGLFAVAGFASGPVYPMIMSIAGSFYPNRASMVSGLLASAAVLGSMGYPPLMGFISDTAGLGVGMFGAGLFGIAAGAAVLLAGSAGRREASA